METKEGQPARHYLFVVHGTWNNPDGISTKWYQPGGTFATQLAERLENGPLANSLFREIDGKVLAFSWSGDNTDAARSEGASRLADVLIAIRRRDPDAVFDFVSHSHGGNVTLRALQLYFEALYRQGRLVGENYIGTLERNGGAVTEALERAVFYEWPHAADEAVRSRASTLDLARQLLRPVTSAFLEYLSRPVRSGFWWKRRDRRAREMFMNVAGDRVAIPWCSYADSHRIGRLVFLGTPFLYKRWRAPVYRRWLLSVAFGICVLSAAIQYVLVSLVSGALALLPRLSFIGLNPLSWPAWALAIFIPIAVCIGVLIQKVGPPISARRDVNFYFDIQNSHLRLDGRHTQLDSLVISAEQFDEALLALSSEPLLHAHLMPRIRTLLRPPLELAKRPRQIGVARDSTTEWLAAIGTYPFWAANALFALTRGVLLRALRPLLMPFLKETFRRAICSAASGLPPEELREAYLEVGAEIREPFVFAEHKWDISKLLASRETGAAVHRKSDAGRYEYLWSVDVLKHRTTGSSLWQTLTPSLPEFLARVQPDDRPGEFRRLAKTCVSIEEKSHEFSGLIELGHSQYYADPEVIAAIAAFLETGQVPSR